MRRKIENIKNEVRFWLDELVVIPIATVAELIGEKAFDVWVSYYVFKEERRDLKHLETETD